MSVVTKNPFALLHEDEPSPPASEPTQPPATTNDPSTRGAQRGGRGGRGSRGGKYYARGGPRTSAPREGAEDEGADDSVDKKVAFADDGRGRGRGGRGGRGRGDRGGPRGDKEGSRGRRREHDRHSASGKTDSDKKIHQSWGGDEGQTELATETAAADDAAAENAAPAESWGATGGTDEWGAGAGGGDDWGAKPSDADWAPPPTGPDTNAGETTERSDRRSKDRQEEEEDNTLTLDQYLAQQKEKTALIPHLEIRKIEQNEGLWKDAKELVKGAEEAAYFVGKGKAAPKTRAKKEEKVYLEIDARFERPSRGGRGRGGDRGGGERGGRGTRGQRRGSRPNDGTSPVNVDDEVAFPSLS